MTFRAHLRAAGIDRARLEADNATEEPVDFRSLRDSYATWSAIAGVGDRVLQRRMGHAGPTTTDRYIKAAESFGVDAIGDPFPALPTTLLVMVWPNQWTRKSRTPGFRRGLMVARARNSNFLPSDFKGLLRSGCRSRTLLLSHGADLGGRAGTFTLALIG